MDITPPAGNAVSSQHPSHPSSGHLDAYKHWLGGMHLKFPSYKHDHPQVIDVNKVADDRLTVGQKVADKVASTMGSWNFIITQATIMVIWITLNLVGWFYHWDLYPFVLLNLAMSAQAAFATPLIMMSQNRQSEKDRLTAQNDYITDCKGEEEVRHIMNHLDHQDELILQIIHRLETQHEEILVRLRQLTPEQAGQLVSDLQQINVEDEFGNNVAGNS